MIALVAGVDAVAIGAFYLTKMARAAPSTRMVFTGVWMLVTLAVVLVGLTRIRRARLEAFREEKPRA
jgi:hypothetical protein